VVLGQVKLVVTSVFLFQMVVGSFGFQDLYLFGFKTLVAIMLTGQ